MSINTTLLCTRLGKLVAGLNGLNTFRQTTLGTRFDTIDNQYESADQDLVDGIYNVLATARTNLDLVPSYFSALASDSIIRAVYNDRPEISQTIFAATAEWLRQFKLASDTFEDSATTYSVSHPGGSSDTQIAVLTPGDLVIPDTYILQVTTDSERGSTKWQEPISILGTNLADFLGPLYPQGSGVAATTLTLDGEQNVGWTNGSLSTFTVTNTPDDWTVVSGSVGTNIRESTQTVRTSARKVLRLTNAGSVKNNTATLLPDTYYTISFRYKRVTDNGGTLSVTYGGLTEVDRPLAGMTGSWQTYAAIFKTAPSISAYDQVVVALGGGGGTDDVYVCDIGIEQVTPLYPLGCLIAAWSGVTAPTVADQWSVPVTLSTGSMTTSLLRGIDRLVGLRYMGFEFPTTTGVATQPDSLVS